MALEEIEKGTIVGESVRVMRTLHMGAVSAVYEGELVLTPRASDPDVEKASMKRAVKVVGGAIGRDGRFRQLLQEESQRLARIDSPLIVPALQSGVDEALEAAYVVMPLETGEPLGTFLEKKGSLDFVGAFHLIEQIALGLAAAHDTGLVHRDLKPEAILVSGGSGEPSVRLLFLGAGKLASEAKRNTTAAMNRPLWMAPEQAETDVKPTPAADTWSLGLLTYYILTGHLFWKAGRDAGSAMMTLLREVLYDAVPSASARGTEQGALHRLPPGFDAWFARACARAPQDRFQHARDAILALAPCFADFRKAATPEPPRTAPTGGDASQDPARASRGSLPPLGAPPPPARNGPPSLAPISLRQRSKRLIAALAGALAAVVVIATGLIIYFVKRANDADTRRSSSHSETHERSNEASVAKRLEEQRRAAMVEPWSDTECPVPVSSRDPAWGERNAPVTLVEYSSFDCARCATLEKGLMALRSEYGKKRLRIVWKTRPTTPAIDPVVAPPPPFSPGPGEDEPSRAPVKVEPPIGPHADAAAVAARTVYELVGNDGFWKFEASAFANAHSLEHDDLLRYAVAAGAARDAFETKFALTDAGGGALEELGVAERLGVQTLPALFINGRHVPTDAPIAQIETMVDVAEQEAMAESKSGTAPERVYATLAARNFSPFPKELPKTEGPAEDATIYRVPVGDSPSEGPKDATITIVEFGDYQCPYTRRAASTLDALRLQHEDLRVVWKDNPLPFHSHAEPAAELAREVKAELGEAAFWRVKEHLLSGGEDLDDSDLRFAAEAAGVDPDGAMAAIPIFKYRSAIVADQDLAADLGTLATPVFYINGRRLVGAQDIERFNAIVTEEEARAQAELAKGTSKASLYDALTKDGKTPGAFDTLAPGAPPKEAPRRGGKKPKIVVQLFSDFQCPTCAEMDATISDLTRGYGDRVSLVFRNRPDASHPDAERAAEAGLEVKAEQGDEAFFKFHDKVIEETGRVTIGGARDPDALDVAHLRKYAKDAGCDPKKFDAALDAGKQKDAVAADQKAGDDLSLPSAPVLFIGDTVVRGKAQKDRLKRAIDKALAHAK